MSTNETKLFSAQNAAIIKIYCDDKQELRYSVVKTGLHIKAS